MPTDHELYSRRQIEAKLLLRGYTLKEFAEKHRHKLWQVRKVIHRHCKNPNIEFRGEIARDIWQLITDVLKTPEDDFPICPVSFWDLQRYGRNALETGRRVLNAARKNPGEAEPFDPSLDSNEDEQDGWLYDDEE